MDQLEIHASDGGAPVEKAFKGAVTCIVQGEGDT